MTQINHMSLKDNYKQLSEKFGGPYTLVSKGISKDTIRSILRGSDICVSKASEVAKALGVTMEELYLGTEKAQEMRAKAAEYWGRYRPRDQDEERYIGKLIEIMRGTDEEAKVMVKKILDNTVRDAWTQAERDTHKKTMAKSSA